MTLLMVDDQIHVIEGLLNGLDFEKVKIDKVLTAHSAAQAKEKLLMYPVDILLCDIEMPGENGLSLLRWAKDHHMDLECIFLTAHADFTYAKTAMKLDGFDYILQPARYEEILSSIKRALLRIEERRQEKEFSSLGKQMFQQRKNLTDQAVHSWWEHGASRYDLVKESLSTLGLSIPDPSPVFPIYLQIHSWKGSVWEKNLLRYALENIVNELLEEESVSVSFWELGATEYLGIGILSFQPNSTSFPFVKKMEQFHTHISELLSCVTSLYIGDFTSFTQCQEQFPILRRICADNVAQQSGVFFTSPSTANDTEVSLPDAYQLANYLQRGLGVAAMETCTSYFDTLQENHQLNALSLQMFYHHFYQILSLVEVKTNTSHRQIFDTKEKQYLSLHAHETLAQMLEFLRLVTSYFNMDADSYDSSPSGYRIEEVKAYIHAHLDEEIRREDIATALFLNPNYLSRMFKTETGNSLKEYITNEKMKMAQSLLKNSKLPVYIIAQKVGYSNFSHFSQVYKKTFQISPTDERAGQE